MLSFYSLSVLRFPFFKFFFVALGFACASASNAQTSSAPTPTGKSLSAAARAQVDLDALVKVESKTTGSDGVTRTSLYEERFMRRGDQIWTQRVLPKTGRVHEHVKEGHSGHKHLDPFEGGRLVSLEDGKPQLRLISAGEKRVVSVPSVEFGNLGFDGSWERAYYWVTQLEFKSFKPSSRVSDVADAQWFEKTGDVNEFILWDHKRQIPRVIESTHRQGNQWRKISVTPRKEMTAVVPWSPQLIKRYDQMLYSDFLD
jgi:hypothetical protein